MDQHEYVAQHLDRIPGNPKLIGREYHTQGGIIDILAQYENGDLLVIEVKPGLVTPWACIQILRYCGAIIEQLEILKSDKKVEGLLIGRELDKHAQLIFQALPPDQFQFISLDGLALEV
ncbi:Endonuclease NucS [subsurface metagenome]